MSLDNANPTVFQTATGGGRKRFKNLLSFNAKGKEVDEMDGMSVKEMLNYEPVSKYSIFLQRDEAPMKDIDQKVDYIDAEEIYSKIRISLHISICYESSQNPLPRPHENYSSMRIAFDVGRWKGPRGEEPWRQTSNIS